MIVIEPTITGNNTNSYERSIVIATKGLEAAGGCIILKYTIKTTASPTANPNE